MNSAEKIKRLFKNAELRVHPDTDEKVFNDVLQAQQDTKKNLPPSFLAEARRGGNIWRITMKSPLVKLAIAAVVIIACLIGLSLWRTTGSGIALANVLARIEQVSVYMYKMSTTVTGQMVGDKPIDRETQATALVSQEHGMKMSMETLDPNSGRSSLQEWYMLPQKKAMIMLMPDEKKYIRMDYDDTLIERQHKQNNDPRAMVQQILRCDYTSLGKSTIDGIEVEGFQTTDPNYLGNMLGEVDVKIWVDVKTQLPVLSEMDSQMSDQRHMHIVTYDFQWDVSVDAAEFEPVIPDDYTTLPGGPIKMPTMNEETAIKGLKLCADLNGNYPEKLDLIGLLSKIKGFEKGDTPAAKQLLEETKGLTEEAKAGKIIEIMKPILGMGTFYTTLVQDKKDPSYYGKIVTPQDADKVLMRWKVSDSEYRVIFGDLHAETVTAEKLAVLEAALPK